MPFLPLLSLCRLVFTPPVRLRQVILFSFFRVLFPQPRRCSISPCTIGFPAESSGEEVPVSLPSFLLSRDSSFCPVDLFAQVSCCLSPSPFQHLASPVLAGRLFTILSLDFSEPGLQLRIFLWAGTSHFVSSCGLFSDLTYQKRILLPVLGGLGLLRHTSPAL